MARNGCVIGRFPGSGETGNAVQLSQGGKSFQSAAYHLMGIALVTHIENDAVPAAVIYPVEGRGKLHSTQIGGQVASCLGHIFHYSLTQFHAEALKLRCAQSLYIGGGVNFIQNIIHRITSMNMQYCFNIL